MSKRILVTGSRNYSDYEMLCGVLDNYVDSDSIIINGYCAGADRLSNIYAAEHGIQTEIYMADWRKYGKAAGPLRNQRMVDSGADICIAFSPGIGTKDCMRRAKKAGIKVVCFGE